MIHTTSYIHPNARIGSNVKIGPFCTIHENVVIGDNSIIDGYCELGVTNYLCDNTPLIIGNNSHIRSHSILYSSTTIGSNCITGHRVTIREKTIIGDFVQIGTLSDIQGHCQIGNYVKTHSNVHIGQKSIIHDFVWLFPYVVLTNDPHPPSELLQGVEIKEFAVIATMTVILPNVIVGKDSFIGAHSLVTKNVPDGMFCSGNPAKIIAEASKIKLKDGTRRSAYPWRKHFHRGYPQEIIEEWMKNHEE